jgi:hypothetical protein
MKTTSHTKFYKFLFKQQFYFKISKKIANVCMIVVIRGLGRLKMGDNR